MERGLPPPAWYLEEPEALPPFAEFYFSAFWELSTERQIGMGIGPIPASQVDRYVAKKRLVGYAAELFRIVVRALDAAYLKYHKDEQEKKQARARSESKSRNKSSR